MKRTIQNVAVAMLALIILAGGTAKASSTFDEYLKQSINDSIRELCEEKWNESSASKSCRLSNENIHAHSSNNGQCDLKKVNCRAGGRYGNVWHYNDWTGAWYEIPDISNCSGELRLGSC